MPSTLPVVITQSPLSPSSIAPNSTTSSAFLTSSTSSSSGRSYISSTSSSSGGSYVSGPHTHSSATRPAQVVSKTPYGHKEFVYTGRPQGGNPCGGPSQNMEGYERVSRGNVTVHNTGGQSRGVNVVKLGMEHGNDESHTPKCRDLSRYSDSIGMCFCPPTTGN